MQAEQSFSAIKPASRTTNQPIDYGTRFTTTHKPASPSGTSRPNLNSQERLRNRKLSADPNAKETQFESEGHSFDQNANFSAFLKEQEKERNRKFLRYMVRLVRKAIGVKPRKTEEDTISKEDDEDEEEPLEVK